VQEFCEGGAGGVAVCIPYEINSPALRSNDSHRESVPKGPAFSPMFWSFRNCVLDLSNHAVVMGVLNLTPDSFSDGGSWVDPDRAIAHGIQMHQEGAAILDIGGESTRPGATPVDEAEELRRVIPVIKALTTQTQALISVDTRKVSVARAALSAGATIVNDVSGLQDPQMRQLIRETRAGAIVMHMQGNPETMQNAPFYGNVATDIRRFFSDTLTLCQADGIAPDQLVFDPGIGFGKTATHNLRILKHLKDIRVSGRPLALGVSRKFFLGQLVGSAAMNDRSWPTVALTAYARHCGVSVIRVHEILKNVQSLQMTEAILEGVA
jgi:dihydropteroate synthase